MDKNRTIKRENFIRISENRVSKAIVLFDQLKNLSNTSFYEYSEEDIKKIFSTLELELKKTKELLLRSTKKKNNRFEL